MTSNKACCWILGTLAGGFILMTLIFAWGVSRAMSGALSGNFPQGAGIALSFRLNHLKTL